VVIFLISEFSVTVFIIRTSSSLETSNSFIKFSLSLTSYFVIKSKEYIRDLPKESYDGIFGFLNINDINDSSVTTAQPVK